MERNNRGEALVLLLNEDETTYEFGLLDLRNDVVFKAFFDDRRNNHLLLDFLCAVLNESIVAVELTNPYIEPSHSNDKSSEMDLRILTDKEELINVEMQFQGHKAFKERMLIYWAKMYGVQDRIGKSYWEHHKAFQIVVTNFNLLSKPHYHSKFQIIDPEDGTLFSSHMEIHVLELPKLKGFELKDATKLEQWLNFLKGDIETKEELAMESSIMQEALKEIQRLSEDPETRKAAIAREIHMKDQLQRELEAKVDGIQEGKAEIILNMYHNQYSVEAIAAITNVPIADVSRIVKSNLQ